MIGYHYSPVCNRRTIEKHGLLVPTKHPKLVVPVVCSNGHRNPHVSLARNPHTAWSLSGGFLLGRTEDMPQEWDLYQVNLCGMSYQAYGIELQSRQDIPRSRVFYVGSRWAK